MSLKNVHEIRKIYANFGKIGGLKKFHEFQNTIVSLKHFQDFQKSVSELNKFFTNFKKQNLNSKNIHKILKCFHEFENNFQKISLIQKLFVIKNISNFFKNCDIYKIKIEKSKRKTKK